MSKFNKPNVRATPTQPGTTTGATLTYEGGKGYTRDRQSELMLLAVNNMVGEDTFYESASDRDDRFAALVRECAVADGLWMLNFVTWLRGSANMRSASVVAACEAVHARLEAGVDEMDTYSPVSHEGKRDVFNGNGINRDLVSAACLRADEPGELLAYWLDKFGRSIPNPVKRGLSDAAARLYNGKTVIKYDSKTSGVRFGDLLDLTHAKPDPEKQPWQGDVFEYCLDVRHHPATAVAPESNKTLTNYSRLMKMPKENRRKFLEDATRLGFGEGAAIALKEAGMTWEVLAGWLQGPMDRVAWEAIIPSMGAMALVRNLRNFDEVGVNDDMAKYVCDQISNPVKVRESRMFPYRMLKAYGEAPSNRWAWALEKALDAACAGIPKLSGKTLVLVDTSGSMTGRLSSKSSISYIEVGALIGVSLAARGSDVDLVGFATGHFHFPLKRGGSVLKQTEAFCKLAGTVGHGTETFAAIKATFKPGVHKRVVIVTDEQAFQDYRGSVSEAVPKDVPLFGINPGGYGKASIDTSQPGRYTIGGFNDAMFTVMGLLAEGRSVGWPWEH